MMIEGNKRCPNLSQADRMCHHHIKQRTVNLNLLGQLSVMQQGGLDDCQSLTQEEKGRGNCPWMVMKEGGGNDGNYRVDEHNTCDAAGVLQHFDIEPGPVFIFFFMVTSIRTRTRVHGKSSIYGYNDRH